MIFDRLTWVGFMVAALGWTLLLSAPQLSDLFASLTGRSGGNLNMPAIAQCVIVTGFGIAIIGALQTGFGALNKFFESVLERSGNPRTRAIARPPTQQKKIIERGWVKDRAYLLYMDGSVEVETMLGRRVFPSLQDAQEFIA
ncbi:MAG: hypothetical protein L0Y60_11970 [Beijerinckiaceae bacterium]|nr:hypothetical protein [Beijerinckiaceae bacterium]